MQIVQERGSVDKPLTFNIGLLQLHFHIINPRCACAAKVIVVVVCVCMCVTTHNCRLAHWNNKTKIPTSS